jgi:undecaprenyl diphosphate synthase
MMSRLEPAKLPRHVAIIPDGNGRWAEARGLPRNEGHRVGTETMREVVRAAHELGIRWLTVYAFSQENRGRPPEEVDAIMDLLASYVDRETDELLRNGIRLRAIGRLGDLPRRVQERVERTVRLSESNAEMTLTFALAYGGRAELVDAARRLAREVESGRLESDAIDEKAFQSALYAPDLPDPDLLIRTGVENRISNFLLWQLSYTELYFSEVLWPDFGKEHLVAALRAYQARERRFGKTSEQVRERS